LQEQAFHHIRENPPMLTITLLAAVLLAPAAFAADPAPAAAPAAAAPDAAPAVADAVPPHNCKQPQLPLDANGKLKKSNELNPQISAYQTCINAYISARQAAVKANQEAGNAAVREFNAFADRVHAAQPTTKAAPAKQDDE
jgi:hypothetical protein